IMLLIVGATTAVRADDPVKGAIKFDALIYDFGEVAYGSDVSHVFNFKNVSKQPVAIKNVTASCGCTTPSWTKEPVMPNKSGNVSAKYDSTRIGAFTKTLTVDVDGEIIVLTIKGTVKEPAGDKK
ncbi:MAG: DUF1573 domain-containing protein, partial [Sphingobacteriales bacterium]